MKRLKKVIWEANVFMKPFFNKVEQISIVVKDISKVSKTYADNYGIGPWSMFELNKDNIKDMIFNNKKSDYRVRIAVANIGNMEIELVEPLNSLSNFAQFLKKYGEGLYSVGYKVENYRDAVNFLKNRGVKINQGGNWLGRYQYSYFDTEKELGHIVKIYNITPGFMERKTDKYGNAFTSNPPAKWFYPEKNCWSKAIKPFFQKIVQVAFIVKSVDSAVKTYADIYGIGPWPIWEFNSHIVNDMKMNGRRKDYRMKVAIIDIGDTQIELIEPLDDITIYSEYLKEHGEGFHHLGWKVEDFDKAIASFKSKGTTECMSGNRGGHHFFAYFNCKKDIKHIVEIFKTLPNSTRPVPIAVYP
jgi:hypothetical protein